MIFEQTQYREILRNTLVERSRAHSQYSLRAFARDLDLSPAQLSEILKGKKGLSRKTARTVAHELGFNLEETEHFCDLVESEHGRNRISREIARAKIQAKTQGSHRPLQLDVFQVVSDWYHFAILQLIKLPGWPKSGESIPWISKRLGISRVEASSALDRLERLELVEKKDGRYQVTSDYVFSSDGVPSEAIRKFHRQVLEKAIGAQGTQSLEDREFRTALFPICREDLPKAKKRMREFQKAFVDRVSATESPDRVYCFSMQLFNLTTQEER